ncbi:MAG: 6-phosphogluconolactonase [Luminiphilus sp.]|nr:6-phosphogluconolactonase [Luminiphilus sp.]
MSEHGFASADALHSALAKSIAHRLQDGIKARGRATLVVSGGSTPRPLFAQLATAKIPWEHVTILLADERWVPTGHSASNETMVRKNLLQGQAAAARFLSLIPDLSNEASNLREVCDQLDQLGTFDVVILGMGGDRHTASLFPCAAEINEGLSTSNAALITHPRTAPHTRISLSRQRLEDCHWGAVHIVGKEKLEVAYRAMTISEAAEAPIAVFLSPRGQFQLWHAP